MIKGDGRPEELNRKDRNSCAKGAKKYAFTLRSLPLLCALCGPIFSLRSLRFSFAPLRETFFRNSLSCQFNDARACSVVAGLIRLALRLW